MADSELSTVKLTLVRTAEQLVAERGLRGVSAREVVKAAGQRNNSAIAYHFGSWEGLLAAVWDLHAAPINKERVGFLARARSAGPPELPVLVDAYVAPLITELGRYSPSYWAQFTEQWMVATRLDFLTSPELSSQPEEQELDIAMLDVLQSLFRELAARLDHLPVADRPRRVSMMARFVIAALAAWERDAIVDAAQPLESLGPELANLALALLRALPAPATHQSGDSQGGQRANADEGQSTPY